jgi:hypothetical protein
MISENLMVSLDVFVLLLVIGTLFFIPNKDKILKGLILLAIFLRLWILLK